MSYGIYSQNPIDNYYLNKIKDLKDELRVTEHKDAVNTLLKEYQDKLLASQLYRVMFPDETSDSELEADCKRGKNIRLQIAIYGELLVIFLVITTYFLVC